MGPSGKATVTKGAMLLPRGLHQGVAFLAFFSHPVPPEVLGKILPWQTLPPAASAQVCNPAEQTSWDAPATRKG